MLNQIDNHIPTFLFNMYHEKKIGMDKLEVYKDHLKLCDYCKNTLEFYENDDNFEFM